MAELIWTEPALQDLETIAEFIASDDPAAASRYLRQVLAAAASLKTFPGLGQVPAEIEDLPQYRQLVGPPCRIFYKVANDSVYILYVMRGERRFDRQALLGRSE